MFKNIPCFCEFSDNSMKLFSFLSNKLPVDTQRIEQAISHLEQQTSAELRVVVERKAKGKADTMARANQLFDELKMRETAERNGVLIYLSFKPHNLAIVGDQAIHEKVGQVFWQSVYDAMKLQCQQADYTQAICQGIKQVEVQLATYFPRRDNDMNELSNEVVIK
ncbi:putative membrane protein [Actinobacillus pleuropneumoniae]|uniref:Predicted membrane protein n=2 Tax=Actinobacillus pleuropneumoniae TaxID=715 RepID=A0A828PZN1_ACTPL|nr:Predicted membrane protein [Actinobacillus pleuropneumoniae serovar 6 str. Femo]EFN01327.1 Predicted membrane protein [Actinobacillus pleuropneumoniae serovar 12 str. 1096]KIE92762.1 putative membrane protein [Actinobacillus pleuropneumoniae]CUU51662.1 putative membrane protein [Actinobacillus pleuropneumoniae serovar 8]KIE93003.1 putative membrane protein [Actinobacillus pleuropneumoniae]